MVSALKLWTVIVVVGGLNYLSRLSFIAFFASRQMPPLLARSSRYVPAAMLTALILPMVVTGANGVNAFATPRVYAALVATVVGFLTRSTLATLGVGMGALWVLQGLLHA
jgi:branched-subunit amino acid transport protein